MKLVLKKVETMKETIVIGHKNPDTDSICSAYCYAAFKNSIENTNMYLSARCGALNTQTKFIFNRFNIEPPLFMKDVYAKVNDIMTRNVVYADANAPIMDVMKNIEKLKIRLTPIVANDGKYAGIVSILELADFFMTGDTINRPVYRFRRENFGKVLEGFYKLKGGQEFFDASLVIGAMPYDRFKKRVAVLNYCQTVLIVGKRRDIIQYAIDNQFPALILTGFKDEIDVDMNFDGYQGTVFVSSHDTAETLRRIVMSVPAENIMNLDVPMIKESDYLDYVKDLMLQDDHRGLPVVDDNGYLIGIVTRSNLLKKVLKKLILVDHNELSQAIDGAEKSEICEIIDHHRLGTPKTKFPVYFYAKPVGSTCTLIYQLYKINNILINKEIASLLLSGVLSDTIVLKSPTTTNEDISAVEELSQIAEINYIEYGCDIFSSSENLKDRDPLEVINADFKEYDEFGVKIGIGQVEIVNMTELTESSDKLLESLKIITRDKNLGWGMLLITDIMSGQSCLLSVGMQAAETLLAYRKISENIFDLPGVLSRKKQLLPEVLRVVEELNS